MPEWMISSCLRVILGMNRQVLVAGGCYRKRFGSAAEWLL